MKTVRVFVSYSHQDRRYLAAGQLIGYLRGLEPEGVEFWSDEQITAGDKWDQDIRREIALSDIGLVLVSQPYLDSQYCRNIEIVEFLRTAEERGLVIFPVLLSPCERERHEWLRDRQFLPSENTIESHFKTPGKRKQLYLEIRQHLRRQIERIRAEATFRAETPVKVRVWCQNPDSPRQSRDISLIAAEHRQRFRVGDRIVVGVQTDADCEIGLMNVGTSRKCTVLLPNDFVPVARAKAGEACWFPDASQAYEFRLTGPPGTETIIAFAGQGPFDFEAASDGSGRPKSPAAEARCYLEVAAV